MKSVLLGILLFPIATIGFAQEGSTTSKEMQIPKFILGFDVFSLFNPLKQSASITGDYRVSPRMTVDASVGYYLNANFIFIDEKKETYRGPQFKMGTKFYFRIKEKNAWYIGVEAKHDRIIHKQWQTILRQGSQYSEVALVPRKVNTWGAAGRIGRLFYLDRSKKFILDVYGGIGVNHHTVKSEFSNDEMFEEFTFLINNDHFILPNGVSILPTLVYGIHLGYAFW